MAIPKPTVVPRWASAGDAPVTEPADGHKNNGWNVGDRPAAQHMNWLLRHLTSWSAWLNDLTDQALTWTQLHTFSAGASVTGLIANGFTTTSDVTINGSANVTGNVNADGQVRLTGATPGLGFNGQNALTNLNIPKAWVLLRHTHGQGAPTVLSGFNVASVAVEGMYEYRVNWSRPFISGNYAVVMSVSGQAASPGFEANNANNINPVTFGAVLLSTLAGTTYFRIVENSSTAGVRYYRHTAIPPEIGGGSYSAPTVDISVLAFGAH